MGATLVLSPGKTTCKDCSRPVQVVRIDGRAVALDPEVTSFVPSGRAGEVVAGRAAMPGRRVHAEMCQRYQLDAAREKNRREMAAFTKAQKARGRLP